MGALNTSRNLLQIVEFYIEQHESSAVDRDADTLRLFSDQENEGDDGLAGELDIMFASLSIEKLKEYRNGICLTSLKIIDKQLEILGT